MTDFPFAVVGFDLDGTLLDTHGDLAASVNHALSLEGRAAIPPREVRTLIGGGAKQMLRRALEATGDTVRDERFDALHAELLAFYAANISVHTVLFPGGDAMLAGLADWGVQVAVVTNKLERLAVQLLGALGLRDRFFAIIGGDTLGLGRGKPKPDLLNEMIARGPGGRTIYVGDTTYDVSAARAAGLPCVAVSFGFNDMTPDRLGADAVIDHFDELIPVLQRL